MYFCRRVDNSMKKLVLTLALLLPIIAVQAQDRKDSKAEIFANMDLAGGVYRPYPEGQPMPPKAPAGYKPFYMSHIGRHGSRYAIGSTVYADLYEVFADAAGKGNLTAEGETVWQAYRDLYPTIRNREGNLTKLGQNQLRRIADQVYRDYKPLFQGKTRAEVLSTESSRVVLSMSCFLDEMLRLDRDFEYTVDYGRKYYSMLVPESTDTPEFVPRPPFPDTILDAYDKFASECLDSDALLGRWFSNPDALSADKGDFLYNLCGLVDDFPNLDFHVSETLSGLFTAEEHYHLWQIQNYSDYLYTARVPGYTIRRCLEMSVLARDIIGKYEEDTANGVSMRLRFSHDTAIMPLLSYLGVNGMDAEIQDPREVEYYWRNYDVPMGANLQIVFFKSKKAPDDILIQVLLNGFLATLPLPEAAPGFYHWADFVERFNRREVGLLKVMSYNIRFGKAKDGDNSWDNRKAAAAAMIMDQKPAVFGVQEALDFQLEYIQQNCPGYGYIGVGREDGEHGGEHMAVFYDSQRMELKNWGTYWLSETPEVPSKGWDARCKRTATWALFYDRLNDRHFYFVNTHLDHVGVQARINGLALVVERIGGMNPENYPMILMGDFNVHPENSCLDDLRTKMLDAWNTAAEADYGDTYHGWGKHGNSTPIDYIFHKGFTSCLNIQRVRKEYLGVPFVSDHYPVTSVLEY